MNIHSVNTLYFGANIYPETVSIGLEQSPICDGVTGKFVMQVQEDTDRNSVFSIVVAAKHTHPAQNWLNRAG